MSKKRILLIGDGNHQFITNYAFWLRNALGLAVTIDILSFSPILNENSKFYNHFYQIPFNSAKYKFFSRIRGIKRFYRFFLYKNLVSKLSEYDFFHFHYISVDSSYLADLLKRKSRSRIILSIWGSDLYKLNPKLEREFYNTCLLADHLTFTNPKSIDYFKTKYNWSRANLELCRFGLVPLEYLKCFKMTREECKQEFSIRKDQIAITLGYNLSPYQQHIKVLKQFDKEELKKLKDQIVFMVPITYGGSSSYKKQIIHHLEKLPFRFILFDIFMTDEQIAKIRLASDIMIQVQETDQFSGSMQEYLYTKNVVITGSWLPYETLKSFGVNFVEVDDLNELSGTVFDAVRNLENYRLKCSNNPGVIQRLSSWPDNIKEWIKLYQE